MPLNFKRFSTWYDKRERRRYIENGFDLDLTYIKPNIIAMSYPHESLGGMFRNHMDEVVKFLDQMHSDHYRVYNLCAARSYDSSKFHMRAIAYPFSKHGAPPFELLTQVCEDMSAHLMADYRNVAVVHCCNGVARTGVMIAAYLLHAQIFDDARNALEFFADARTQNRMGVSIPSQQRYVHYYGHMLKNKLKYSPNTVYLRCMRFCSVPCIQGGSCAPLFTIKVQNQKVYTSKVYDHIRKGSQVAELMIPLAQHWLSLCGDVMVEFFHQPRFGSQERMFAFCFNTCFIGMHLPLQQGQQSPMLTTKMQKRLFSESISESDSSSNEINRLCDRAQSSSPFLTVPLHDQTSISQRSLSLTDVSKSDNSFVPIHEEQRSSSASDALSELQPRNRVQTGFQFMDKKTMPQSKQLKKMLRKAGKHAGIDITMGFSTVLHKPITPKHPQQKSSIDYQQKHVLSPLVRSTTKFVCDEQIDNNLTSDTADGNSITDSGKDSSGDFVVEDCTSSSDTHTPVTFVFPLSELDVSARDKKHFPADFQLHMVLSGDGCLVKDIENSCGYNDAVDDHVNDSTS